MKVKKIKVPFYKWKIVSIVAETHEDKEEILKKMKSLSMRKEDIASISSSFDNESMEGANCYINDSRLLCVIITFPHYSALAYASTLIHEGRHATDRIIETVGLEGVEAPAYLNEFVTLELIKDYIKDETY